MYYVRCKYYIHNPQALDRSYTMCNEQIQLTRVMKFEALLDISKQGAADNAIWQGLRFN